MNKAFDDYDTELQCEEYYEQPPTSVTVLSNGADVAHDAISSSQSLE
jgi:hypothetical protein